MSAVDDYQTATDQLAARTTRAVLAAYADMTAQRIPPNTAMVLIAAVINRANASAVSLADMWLSVQIEELAGQPVPTAGVLPVDDSDRLIKATDTILSANRELAEPESVEMRLERLARSEVLETGQRATHEAMQRQPLVEGWVRQFDADPCQLCVWWWREGRTWPNEPSWVWWRS